MLWYFSHQSHRTIGHYHSFTLNIVIEYIRITLTCHYSFALVMIQMFQFTITLFLLFHRIISGPTEMKQSSLITLPQELFFEIAEFDDLRWVRGTCKEMKRRFEEYLERRRLKGKEELVSRFGTIRTWQLSHLFTKDTCDIQMILAQAYNPMKSKNHIKLVRFIADHEEFCGLYEKMRADVKGFIEPIVRHYSNRIHGLEQFVKVFECEHLLVDYNKKKLDYEGDCRIWRDELEIFMVILKGLKWSQG